MIKLFKPYISEKAKENVQRVLSGSQIAQGPEVEAFENEFAEKFGFEPWQIVSLNSGTAALELAYELANIKGGYGYDDEVITPILTCTATNIPLVRRGAGIVFGDIDGDNGTLNMDPEDVESKINDDTKAIVFVHFGGSSANLGRFEEIAQNNHIDLICDAAQALGAPLSKIARFNCISLQAIKSLTAGDGGVLICRYADDATKARKLRWFGYDRELKQKMGDCDLDLAGYKLHMNDISAAIARGNLAEWDAIYAHRKAINDAYARLAVQNEYIPGIWNPQVIRRSFATMKPLCESAGFEIGQYHYRNDKYSIFKRADSQVPSMDKYNDQYFMLPCHMGMTVEDAERLARVIWPQ
jgi:perosamine synthetase